MLCEASNGALSKEEEAYGTVITHIRKSHKDFVGVVIIKEAVKAES